MQVGEKEIGLDRDGFMLEPQLWNEQVAAAIAQDEGIDVLSDKHWEIVSYIRSYWSEHDMAPPVRMVCQHAELSVRELYKLFTSGPTRGACRIAGLPKPDGCV